VYIIGLVRGSTSKGAEILVLRHELAVMPASNGRLVRPDFRCPPGVYVSSSLVVSRLRTHGPVLRGADHTCQHRPEGEVVGGPRRRGHQSDD
jgi:hypothetical protein